MAKLAPINPAVLDWALKDAGMSDAQLAELARLTPGRLAEFRSGEAPLTGEFKAIAKALSRPPSFFFLPSPPQRPATSASFRTPATRGGHRQLSSKEQEALRAATRWQRIISWARESLDTDHAEIPELVDKLSEAELVSKLTTLLDWDLAEQMNMASPNALLKELRSRIEDAGLLTFQFSLGTDACKGFSIPGTTPVIALNSGFNASARVYTLIHELIHVLRGDRAVCGSPRSDDLERFCERTAAAFLIPANDLRALVRDRFGGKKIDTVPETNRIANRYNVSLRATAYRLVELNLAGAGLYPLVDEVAEFGRRGGRSTEPQTTPVRRIRELGGQVPRTLLRARDEGVLSDVDVRRYLNVNGDELNDVARRLATAGVDT